MQETRIIKIVQENLCPHCSKPIMIATRMTTPQNEWVLKPEDLKEAKKKLKEELKDITFKNDKEKENFLNWIDNEQTLFGPSEIPFLVDQIRKENEGSEVKHE